MNELITLNDIESEFQMGAIVRRKVGCSTYETEFLDGGVSRAAVIKIYELEQSELDPAVARWRRAMELDHPCLLKIYTAGISRMEGSPVAYVVIERADESLAGVLAHRALTSDEVEEALNPTLSALEFLHGQGYAHGGLKASNVFAVGDRLKLASECLIRFDEGGSAADDVRSLGTLLLEVMTSPEGSYNPKPPCGEIVRRCIEDNPAKRWTIEQVRARLSGANPEPVNASTMTETAVVSPFEAPHDKAEFDGVLDGPHQEARVFPKWAIAGLVALALGVLLAAVLRSKNTTAAIPAPASTVVTREAPPSAPPPVERELAHSAAVAHEGAGKGNWSVIVAAYGAMPLAEKRAHSINAKYPAFHVSVIERQHEKARYLVVLGERMSENEAKVLKLRAIRSGLPRDTYIKKLT